MFQQGKSNIWTEFHNVIQTQIVLLADISHDDDNSRSVETEDNLFHLKCLELRLILFCLIHLLQLAHLLVNTEISEKQEMYSPTEKDSLRKEIQYSLSSLEVRLQKYTDDIIFQRQSENETTYKQSKDSIIDALETLFTNECKDEIDLEDMKKLVLHQIASLCAIAEDVGSGQGELTLIDDMRHIVDVVKQLTNFVKFQQVTYGKEKKQSNSTSLHRSHCPCEMLSSSDGSEDKASLSVEEMMDADDSDVYAGSEFSLAWSSARDVVTRHENVPKLEFDFSDSESDSASRNTRNNYNHIIVATPFYHPLTQFEDNIPELENSTMLLRPIDNNCVQQQDQHIDNFDNSDVSPCSSLPDISDCGDRREPQRLISDRSMLNSASVTSSTCRSTVCHPNCFRSFTIIPRDQLDEPSAPGNNIQYSVNMQDPFSFHTMNWGIPDNCHRRPDSPYTCNPVHTISNVTQVSNSSMYNSHTGYYTPSGSPVPTLLYHGNHSPIPSNSIHLAPYKLVSHNKKRNILCIKVLLSLLSVVCFVWLYLSNSCPNYGALKSFTKFELNNIGRIVDFVVNHIEITHYGLPPL